MSDLIKTVNAFLEDRHIRLSVAGDTEAWAKSIQAIVMSQACINLMKEYPTLERFHYLVGNLSDGLQPEWSFFLENSHARYFRKMTDGEAIIMTATDSMLESLEALQSILNTREEKKS